MAPDFSHNKLITSDLQNCNSCSTIKFYSLHHSFSFYSSLSFFIHLTVCENFEEGVDQGVVPSAYNSADMYLGQ